VSNSARLLTLPRSPTTTGKIERLVIPAEVQVAEQQKQCDRGFRVLSTGACHLCATWLRVMRRRRTLG
jgi:hypothetical protein